MTATRIRSRQPATVTAGGGGSGGTNPVGSSLTTDDLGSIEIILAETSTTPVDAATFVINLQDTGETSTTPVEALSYDIVLAATDTPVTPTGAHASTINAGATTVTQTTGTGWANPANAQGVNDGVNATLTGASGVTPTTVSGTLTGVFNNVLNTGGTETLASSTLTLTFYATLNVPSLGTGSLTLSYSADGGSNYTQVAAPSATAPVTAFSSNGPFIATINTFTIGQLSQFRFQAVGSCLGTALGNSIATVDAVVATFSSATNSNG